MFSKKPFAGANKFLHDPQSLGLGVLLGGVVRVFVFAKLFEGAKKLLARQERRSRKPEFWVGSATLFVFCKIFMCNKVSCKTGAPDPPIIEFGGKCCTFFFAFACKKCIVAEPFCLPTVTNGRYVSAIAKQPADQAMEATAAALA